MKKINMLMFLVLLSVFSCSKVAGIDQPAQTVPNGDFELWANSSVPNGWKNNSCPICKTQILTDIIHQSSDAYSGKYAAQLLFNNAYAARLEEAFPLTRHPLSLQGYFKQTLVDGDSVLVKVKLFQKGSVVDSGKWVGIKTSAGYSKTVIPITQSNLSIDSASLIIIGGNKKTSSLATNTVFWVDDFSFNFNQ